MRNRSMLRALVPAVATVAAVVATVVPASAETIAAAQCLRDVDCVAFSVSDGTYDVATRSGGACPSTAIATTVECLPPLSAGTTLLASPPSGGPTTYNGACSYTADGVNLYVTPTIVAAGAIDEAWTACRVFVGSTYAGTAKYTWGTKPLLPFRAALNGNGFTVCTTTYVKWANGTVDRMDTLGGLCEADGS